MNSLKLKALSNKKDFDELHKKGKAIKNKYVKIYMKENGSNILRYAISVSKSIGIAVKRNRIKRVLREILRSMENHLKGFDILIIAKKSIKEAGYWKLKETLEKSLIHS